MPTTAWMTLPMIALWMLAIMARGRTSGWKAILLVGMVALSARPLMLPFLPGFLALGPGGRGHN